MEVENITTENTQQEQIVGNERRVGEERREMVGGERENGGG